MIALARWLYRKVDGVFLKGGWEDIQPPLVGNPPMPDFTNYGVVEFGDADQPDLVLHRFDVALGKRFATVQELATSVDSDMLDRAQATSRQRDILAMVAFAIRQSNPTAWNAMTLAQKKTATFVGADIWRDIRIFVEKNR